MESKLIDPLELLIESLSFGIISYNIWHIKSEDPFLNDTHRMALLAGHRFRLTFRNGLFVECHTGGIISNVQYHQAMYQGDIITNVLVALEDAIKSPLPIEWWQKPEEWKATMNKKFGRLANTKYEANSFGYALSK